MAKKLDRVTFDDLLPQAQKAARALRLTVAVLNDSPWGKQNPAREKLLERASERYVRTVGVLSEMAKQRVADARNRLQWEREQAQRGVADRIEAAFRGVTSPAVEAYEQQLAKLAPRQLLDAYRGGSDWQRLLIERMDLQPKPDARGIVHTPQELGELQGLIREHSTQRSFINVLGNPHTEQWCSEDDLKPRRATWPRWRAVPVRLTP